MKIHFKGTISLAFILSEACDSLLKWLFCVRIAVCWWVNWWERRIIIHPSTWWWPRRILCAITRRRLCRCRLIGLPVCLTGGAILVLLCILLSAVACWIWLSVCLSIRTEWLLLLCRISMLVNYCNRRFLSACSYNAPWFSFMFDITDYNDHDEGYHCKSPDNAPDD